MVSDRRKGVGAKGTGARGAGARGAGAQSNNAGTRARGPEETYPWDKWFSRNKFTITRGKDFHGTQVHSMQRTIWKAAERHGVKVKIRIDGSTMQVHVLPAGTALTPGTPTPRPKRKGA